MLTEERFQRILSIVRSNRSVSVQKLTEILDTSESTIRRDLTILDQQGQLIKVRGGAIAKDTTYLTKDDPVNSRTQQNKDAKIKIAEYAASLIGEKDFVYMDAGTTTELIIDFLTKPGAIFVTNSIRNAQKLSEKGYTTYILGGEFKVSTEAIVGDEAVESLEKYHFTKGFFGTNGVSHENGFSTPDMKEAMVKKKALANCKHPYVLCDYSKFSKISCVTFAEFSAADIITTELENEGYRKYKNILEVNKQ